MNHSNLEGRQILVDLGFTDAWIGLGLLTDDVVGALEVECGMVDEPNPHHYRWKVFMRHVHGLTTVGEKHATDLYDLARSEPEPALSSAMVGALIRRRDCPRAVLELATTLPTPHLAQSAQDRLLQVP
jgi:hypothetical protein